MSPNSIERLVKQELRDRGLTDIDAGVHPMESLTNRDAGLVAVFASVSSSNGGVAQKHIYIPDSQSKKYKYIKQLCNELANVLEVELVRIECQRLIETEPVAIPKWGEYGEFSAVCAFCDTIINSFETTNHFIYGKMSEREYRNWITSLTPGAQQLHTMYVVSLLEKQCECA